jgi:hypothetical protein
MSEWTVYLWTVLNNLKSEGLILGVIVGVGIIGAFCRVFAVGKWDEYMNPKNPEKMISSGLKWAFTTFILMALFSVFVPSGKQFAMIKILPIVVNSEIAKELPADAKEMYSMAKESLKEMLDVKKVAK